MQKRREKAWGISSRDRGMADITDSRRNSLFTFVVTVTKKLENRNKFKRRGKSYL